MLWIVDVVFTACVGVFYTEMAAGECESACGRSFRRSRGGVDLPAAGPVSGRRPVLLRRAVMQPRREAALFWALSLPSSGLSL